MDRVFKLYFRFRLAPLHRGLDDTDAMDGEGGALAMTLTAEGAGADTTRPLLSSQPEPFCH
jgi:hypothetical protein